MNLTRLRLENFKRLHRPDHRPVVVRRRAEAGAADRGERQRQVVGVRRVRVTLSAPHKGDPAPPSTRFDSSFSDDFYKGEAYDKFLRYLKKDPATAVSASCSFGGGFEVGRSEGSAPIASPDGWDVKSAFYGRSSVADGAGASRNGRSRGRRSRPRSPRGGSSTSTRVSTPTSHGSRRTCSGTSGARTPLPTR